MNKIKQRFFISSAFVLIFFVVMLLAPICAPYDPNEATFSNALTPPNDEYLFGTDKMGRDVFSRVLYGAQTSLFYTLILVMLIFVIGITIGVISGFFGGKIDKTLMILCDVMVSFPGMALAIAVCGMMGAGILSAVIAITAVSFTKYARLTRSLVLKERSKDYIAAARLSGARSFRIMWRYVLPSALPTLVITAATDIGAMMLELAAFSFLGLGATAGMIEWGYMLNEGRQYIESAPWLMLYPGLAIFITVALCNLWGDSLRDFLSSCDNNLSQSGFACNSSERVNSKRKRYLFMKKGSNVLGIIFACAVAVLMLAGCSQSKSPDIDTEDKHLNFGCYNYSDSLDPATNVNSSWCGVRYGITECLFVFDDQVVVQPNLCEEYTSSEDFVTWSLQLKEGVVFSNGNPVTASAVKASLERLYTQTDAAIGGTGNSNPESYVTFEKIVADDTTGTITLTCSAPTPNLAGILAYPYFAIIDTEVADTEIVGTGPYKVESTRAGVSLELSKNHHYHNGEVPFDTVNLMFIEDSSTKSMALQSGDIDIAENITTASDINKLSAQDAYYVSTAAGVRTGNSYMNFKGALANNSLREAIIMAIDTQTLCDVVVGGMYTPGISVLPSSLSYNYDQLSTPFAYNAQEAQSLLDEAGIVDIDGDGFRELDGETIDLNYVVYTSRNLNDFAEAVAIQLEEIGIKVTVNVRDYDTALALQNAGEFDMITSNSITVGVGDPQDFLGNWYTPNAVNYGYYSNTEYDAAYEALMVETNPEIRLELITQLQQILIDDASTIVHGYYNSRMISAADAISGAEIATIDYYWITTDIKPRG